MEKDPIMEKLTDMTGIKFCVFDKEKKVMHQAEEICRIHIDKGVPYAVLLWNDEMLMKMSNRKGFILYSYKEGKKKRKVK